MERNTGKHYSYTWHDFITSFLEVLTIISLVQQLRADTYRHPTQK